MTFSITILAALRRHNAPRANALVRHLRTTLVVALFGLPLTAHATQFFSSDPEALAACQTMRDSFGPSPHCQWGCNWFLGPGYILDEVCTWGTRGIEAFRFPPQACPVGENYVAPGVCRRPAPDKQMGCPTHPTGNPCNPAVGNKYEREEDLRINGGALSFARHYNSLFGGDVGFGMGWTSTAQPRLEISTGRANVRMRSGRAEVFACPSSGSCTGDADTTLLLSVDGSGYWLTYPDGTRERYNLSGFLLSETDATGRTTSYGYDNRQRILSVTGPFGHRYSFTYDATDHVSSLVAPNGTYTYQYTAITTSNGTRYNLTRINYPDGRAKLYHYENTNFPHHLTGISYVETNGATTRYGTYGYDSAGKAILTEHASGMERFTLAYDSDTQTTVRDAADTPEVMTFSTNLGVKNLDSRVNGVDGKSLVQTFDANNNVTCRKDEEGRVTTYTYNATNQKTSMTEGRTGTCASPIATAATRTTTYQYASATLDVPTVVTSPSVLAGSNKTVVMGYGDARFPALPTSITQNGFTPTGAAVSRSTSLSYNAYGQVVTINGSRTDVSDITTLAYYECTTGNSCGQLRSVTNALGQATTFDTYDASGRLLQQTDPNGLRTNYTYDPRGRVSTITQTPPGGSARVTQYGYNAAGNVTSVIMPDGVTLTYLYDAAQKLRQISDSLGNRVVYDYDLRGNRTQEATYDPNNALARVINTVYDARNRASSINKAGSLTQLIHDAVGNLARETDPNQVAGSGASTNHAHDSLNRLLQTINTAGGMTAYAYDAADRLIQVQAPNNATTQYQYDDLGNLLRETSPDRGTTIYTYDSAGNLSTKTDARAIATQYRYDALNRLTAIDYPGTAEDVAFTYDAGSCALAVGRLCRQQDESGVTEYDYDAFGNVVQTRKTELGITYVTSYAYDAGDRITAIVYPNGRTVTVDRDAVGRLRSVAAPINGNPTVIAGNLTYRGDGLLRSLTFGNSFIETRTHDLQGRLVTQTRPDANPPANGVDLNVTALSSSITNVAQGTSFSTTVTVRNAGNAAFANDARIRLVLSTDMTMSTADTAIVVDFLPWLQAGEVRTLTFTPTVPTNLPPGTYYLGAIVDDNNVQVESNEANNTYVGPVIVVSAGSGSDVDLAVTSLAAAPTTVNTGGYLNVSVTVQNVGSAPVSQDLRVRVVLSTDTTISMSDTAIVVDFVPYLQAGESSTLLFTPMVPPELPPGTYYVGALADDNNRQAENNETNNIRTGNTVQVQ